MLLAIAFATAMAGAWPHKQRQKVRVHFWATSTFIRGSWGMNEDIYLAELRSPKQSESVLVRLIDTYPNTWSPLTHKILTSAAGTVLAVWRDTECDRPFGEILLRTAPGDLMAILPERLGYKPPLDQMPAATTVLPCYRVLR
jgi:hypothetical protein